MSKRPRAQFTMSLQSLLALAAAAVVAVLVGELLLKARHVIDLIAAAIMLALLAASPVRRLSRHMSRGLAVAIVFVAGLIVAGLLAGLLYHDVDTQANEVRDAVVGALQRPSPDSRVGRFLVNVHATKQVNDFFNGAAMHIVGGGSSIRSPLTRMGQVVLVSVLGAFLLIGAPPIEAASARMWDRKSQRRRFHLLVRSFDDRAGGFLRRTALLSIGVGVLVGLTAYALRAPGPVAFGVWAGLWAFVPMVGIVLAFAPLVIVTMVADPARGYAAIVVALTVFVLAAVARRRIAATTIDPGPFLVVAGLTAGATVAGVVGAALGLTVVTTIAFIASVQPDDRADTEELAVAERVDEFAAASTVEPASERHDDAEPRRLEVNVNWRLCAVAIAVADAVFFGWIMVTRLRVALVWLVVAVFLALGLDRPISAIQRRIRWPRQACVLAFFAVIALVTAGVGFGAGPAAAHAATDMVHRSPEIARRLEDLPVVGSRLARYDLPGKVRTAVDQLPDTLQRSHLVSRVVTNAGNWLAAIFWIVLLTVTALVDGPRLIGRSRGAVPVRHRRRASLIARTFKDVIGRYAAGSALVALLNALMVLTVSLTLRVPLAPVLALWAFGWNFIPQVGGFMGGAPLVALAFTVGPWQGVVAFVVFITYQNIENHLIQPMVVGRSVDLPPWAALIAALVGASVVGVVGAIVAIPLVGAVRQLVLEVRRSWHQ